jgi:hypothetical protein
MTFSENEAPTVKLLNPLEKWWLIEPPTRNRSPITERSWANFRESVESQMATATARLDPLRRAR